MEGWREGGREGWREGGREPDCVNCPELVHETLAHRR